MVMWVSFLKEYLHIYSMKRLLFHGSKITEEMLYRHKFRNLHAESGDSSR